MTRIPNGAVVRKVNSEEGDATPDGSLGTVFASLSVPEVLMEHARCDYFYWVEWEWTEAEIPIGILGRKIEEVTDG